MLNALGQIVNVSILFFIMPLALKKIGEYQYGVLVLFHTIFLILFQFNHIYTSFLKVYRFNLGKSFVNHMALINFFIILLFYILGFCISPFFFIGAIILSTVQLFVFRAILVILNNNGLASFVLPVINVFFLGIVVCFYDSINFLLLLKILTFSYLPILLIGTVTLLDFKLINFYTFKLINFKRVYGYILKRTYQTLYFSMVTIFQTNVDKLMIPFVFDYATLGKYQLISMIPSRLNSLFGNISFVVSKDIHAGDYEVVEKFFKYSNYLMALVSILLIFLNRYIITYLLGYYDIETAILFFIFIGIAFIQPFGFIGFQIFSSLNKLFKFGSVNLVSAFLFICFNVLFFIFNVGPLYSLAISLLMSKVTEFYIGYLGGRYINKSIIKYWVNTFGITLICVVFFILIRLYVFDIK